MKINDKMRLDFLGNKYHTTRSEPKWACIWLGETEEVLGRGVNIRQAIDAAIRAERR